MTDQLHRKCQNCGARLQGRFCHHCGQEALGDSRFFGAVALDLLGSFFSYDSKVNRTLKPLLFKPGFLSNEYINGRRARYISPFRLYLFTSVVCFLLLSLQGNFLGIDAQTTQPGSPMQAEPTFQDIVDQATVETPSGSSPLTIDLPESYRGVEQFLETKVRRLSNMTTGKFMQLVFDTLPPMMLALLPLMALLMKVIYIGSKRYYVEHFVVVLHSQSFLFVLIALVQIIDIVASWLPSQLLWIETAINTLAFVWAFAYIPLMLRRVYRQSRFVTILKYSLLLLIYGALTLLLLLLSLAWNIITL